MTPLLSQRNKQDMEGHVLNEQDWEWTGIGRTGFERLTTQHPFRYPTWYLNSSPMIFLDSSNWSRQETTAMLTRTPTAACRGMIGLPSRDFNAMKSTSTWGRPIKSRHDMHTDSSDVDAAGARSLSLSETSRNRMTSSTGGRKKSSSIIHSFIHKRTNALNLAHWRDTTDKWITTITKTK